MKLEEHCLSSFMKKCPSLTKAIDNDAGAFPGYCNHCPGWVMPLYKKADLYKVYDLMGQDNPQCRSFLYDNLEMAKAKYEKLTNADPQSEILKNW
ncbi:MAG: hypothetical protein WCS73_02195 [Lentisphaeria bacterium]